MNKTTSTPELAETPQITSLEPSTSNLGTQLSRVAILAAALSVITPSNDAVAQDQGIEQEQLSRHDFQLGFNGYFNAYCLENNDEAGSACFEIDPELRYTRVLTRNERSDGRVDGDEDNILDLNLSLQAPIAYSDLKAGLVFGVNSNLGNGTNFSTGLDLDFRKDDYEILLRYIPQNLFRGDLEPFELTGQANFVIVPNRLDFVLGGGLSLEQQAIYIESQDYTVSDDLLAALNFSSEFQISSNERVCAGLEFSIGLTQPRTFGFGLIISNCSHLFDEFSSHEIITPSAPVVIEVQPEADATEGSSQVTTYEGSGEVTPVEGSGNTVEPQPEIRAEHCRTSETTVPVEGSGSTETTVPVEGSGSTVTPPCHSRNQSIEIAPVQPVPAPTATPTSIQINCNGAIITITCSGNCDSIEQTFLNCNQ